MQQARDLLPGQSCFLDAEFDRLQCEWLLAMPQAYQDQAEALFIRALASAGRQGATSLALRAATSLARLRLAQNRQEDALPPLQDLYARFSEGFDTHDLWVAAALLGERGYCSG